MTRPQSVEKLNFRQTDRVQKVVKTSKPSASAYDGTVELGLRCKSKCLAQQAFEVLFCCIGDTFAISYLNTDRQPPKICILTIGDFFDTLGSSHDSTGCEAAGNGNCRICGISWCEKTAPFSRSGFVVSITLPSGLHLQCVPACSDTSLRSSQRTWLPACLPVHRKHPYLPTDRERRAFRRERSGKRSGNRH